MPYYNGISIKTVAVATAITALTAFILNWYNTKKKDRVPQKWKLVGKVTNLFIYPLKSGRRVNLESAECTNSGAKQIRSGKYQLMDRTLVVYKNSAKECRTARTNPKLVLIEIDVDDEDCLVLNAPGMDTLRVNVLDILKKTRGDRREEIITLFKDEQLRIIDCGEEAANWVTKYLTENDISDLRLGLHDGIYRRPINKTLKEFAKVYPNLTYSSMGIYTDLTSFMLINQSSVDELVARIPNSNVSVHNFRPNIIVSDKNLCPYDEDKWEWVKIGDVVFRTVKACTRCMLTTVDQETGIRDTRLEPLKTLRKYRLVKDLIKTKNEKDSPVMGIHLELKAGGIINVGDTVSIAIKE